MSTAIDDFIQETTTALRPLHISYTTAVWEAATTGTDASNKREKEAQAVLMRFWADPERFKTARKYHEEEGLTDPLTRRTIQRIYLAAAKAQQDDESIEKITALEAEIRGHYYNFRAEVDGHSLTDNEIDHILRTSQDADEVHQTWEASKMIGELVANQTRELARVRNQAARKQGFRDHFERMLALNEIDEDHLLNLFEDLDQASHDPFEMYKGQLDQARADRFGLMTGDLRPWHYGDRYFQEAPLTDDFNPDVYFQGQDLVELAVKTYDGIGLEVRDILMRSDLYPREGKNQHAFCLDLDHEGDIRTLNNLVANEHWMGTLLHELGHAVFDKYIDRELPWILRTPSHILTTEAIAILMGSLTGREAWIGEVLGIPAAEAAEIADRTQQRNRAEKLIFTRWVLVMTHFERALYADPEADLDSLWWDLVEKYQFLVRPEGRQAPDWASKYHIPLVPVYYHNYELGFLVASQLRKHLEDDVGGLVGYELAGHWLVERVFRPGNRMDWSTHVESATNEPLNPKYFVDSLTK